MSADTAKALPDQGVAPLNFIYACSICCASFADAYEGHTESVRGFSDGINPKERLVSKLYLASCCHVFCSSHLEGGGPPFHPAGQRPKAPCPSCIKEKDDHELRELYSIRGFNRDEYDPQIPSSWFTAPPIRLDGSGKEMEALRFQYIALIRYCQNTYAARKPIQNALDEAEKNTARLQNLVSEEHAKVLEEKEHLLASRTRIEDLQAEVQRLQGLESQLDRFRRLNVNPRDLETFTTHKSAIQHYLKLVPMLINQNERMKQRLASLGFAMALQPVPNFRELDPSAFDSDETLPQANATEGNNCTRQTTSSQTAGRNTHTSSRVTTAPSSPFNQRPLKRQRQESPQPDETDITTPNSRDAMPPPPKPISRMRSMRKIIPDFRKKLFHGRSMPSSDDVSQDVYHPQMAQHAHWQNVNNERPSTRSEYRRESPYMSGALPVGQNYGDTQISEPRLLSSRSVQNGASDFTFQAQSPVRIDERVNSHQPVRLLAEPSYLRLMDGLSQEQEMELELKDPRQNNSRDHDDDQDIAQTSNAHPSWQSREIEKKKTLWNFGHAFPRRSPHRASQMDQPRAAPQSEAAISGQYRQPLNDPITPSPRRHQPPYHPVESVVSPFFTASHRQAPLPSRTGLAEPQASSNLSGAFQSPRPRMAVSRPNWRYPPSLNGLSFFDFPVDSRNEVIQRPFTHDAREVHPVSQQFSSRSLNSSGFIVRPDATHSSFVGNSTYGSSHERIYAPMPTQSAVPFPSSGTNSYNRLSRPALPRIFQGHSSVHTQPPWGPLQRVGVRSSRQPHEQTIGNAYASPTRNFISGSGRRNVRR